MLQLIIDSKFNSDGVKEAEARVMRLAEFIEREMQTTAGADNFLANQQSAISSQETINALQQQIAKVEQLAMAYKNAAVQQYSLGNIQVGDRISAYGSSLERTAENMRSLTQATEENKNASEKQGGALDFINNKFNKFAFGLFVIQGTIGTVTRLVNQLTDALIESASIADRSNAFNVLLDDIGQNAAQVKAGLTEAAGGALTLDAAMRPTLQLMKANVPEVAAMSDELLRIAVASAKLSGDLSKTEHIYTTLVRGIVRGSPLLIDNADIYLKLGDAVESYASSINKTVDQLTPEDRIKATAQAVADQGQNIVELADKVGSTAEVFQSFKTDLADGWNEISSTIGAGTANTIRAIDELFDVFDPILIKMVELAGGSTEMGIALERAFDNKPILVSIQGILHALDYLGAYIRGYGAEITEIWNALVSTVVTGATLIAEGFRMISSGNYEEGLERISDQYAVFINRVNDAIDPHNQINIELEKSRENTERLATEWGLLGDSVEDATESTIGATNALSSSFNELSAGIQAAIEARTGLSAQFADKRQDIEENLAEKIVDINENLAEKLADISSGLQDKLLDINAKYKEDVADLAKDTAEELSDIDESLADKLSEATETATKSREDAYKNRNKGIEDAQEKHQQKLLDIERKYEASRLKALIDRDARALFEAEQARKQGQQEAADDLSDQIKDEEDSFKERMDTINEQEEERRAKAIEDAAKRRQDALDAQAKELQDLKDNLAKQKQEAIKSAQEQRRDAITAANEKRRDAQEAHRDALQDLDEWYQEQLTLQKERQLQEKINELEHLNEMGELTQEHLNELKAMHEDYNNFVSGASGSGGVGSIGGIVPGGSGTTSSNPGNNGGGTISPLTSGNGANVGDWSNWVGPNGLRLNIQSNDSTLQDVLRSGTYEYMLEALE